LSVEVAQLDCGLTVVTERMPDVRSVTLGFWVGTGSRDEDPQAAGASHFLEHLLFKGTEQRSARQIAEDVDEVGGDMNAFTAKEYTTFYVRLLARNLDLGLDILSDIMWAPAFRAEELEAERQVILEEILMHADEPADLVFEVFGQALFPDHPLGREVLGDEATVRSMTREQIARFHAHHYRPGNIVVAAAGDLRHEEVQEALQRRFKGIDGGSPPKRVPPDQSIEPSLVVTRPTEQAHLVVGMRALDRNAENRQVLTIIDHILGGGMSSRVFQSIRETRGLAYSVYSYRTAFEEAGSLAVYAGTTPTSAKEVLKLINQELDKMLGDGVSERELSMAKTHLKGASALGLEDSAARMSRIGRSQLISGRVLTTEELDDRLDAVTMDDVNGVISKVIGAPRVTAAVGPFEAGELLETG
jgi:predicted Zn-dependent peptidase